jgi:hypothetical protein
VNLGPNDFFIDVKIREVKTIGQASGGFFFESAGFDLEGIE